MSHPKLSLVVLAWNELALTKQCAQSLRMNTDAIHELIVVDNGSEDGTADYARGSADIAVINDENLGFAPGMNRGLAEASGDYVAFINNDTIFPEGWASPLLETFDRMPSAGIVLPAVTAAGNPVSVRAQPGASTVTLTPFGEFPSGVVYMMPRSLILSLGGWNEKYKRASSEDLDLAFTVWAHGLDVVLDERVLVEHLAQASVRHLPDRAALYRQNLEQFLDTWEDPSHHSPLIDSIDAAEFEGNLMRAQTAVIWIRRMLQARNDAADLRRELRDLKQHVNTGRRRGWLRPKS